MSPIGLISVRGPGTRIQRRLATPDAPSFDRTQRFIEYLDLDYAPKSSIAGGRPAQAALRMVPTADAGGGSIHGRRRFCDHDAARAAADADLRHQHACI